MTIRFRLILLLTLFSFLLGIIFAATLLGTYEINSKLAKIDARLHHVDLVSQINSNIFEHFGYSFNYLLQGSEESMKLSLSGKASVDILFDKLREEENLHEHLLLTEKPLDLKKKYDMLMVDLKKSFKLREEGKQSEAINYYAESTENIFEKLMFEELAQVNIEEQKSIKLGYDQLLFEVGIIPWLDKEIVHQVSLAKLSVDYFMHVSNLSSDINKLHKDGFDFILRGSRDEYNDFMANTEIIVKSFKTLKKLIKLNSTLGIEGESEDLIKASYVHDVYISAIDLFHKSFELKMSGKKEAALSVLNNKIEPLIQGRIIPTIEELTRDSFEEIGDAHNRLKKTISTATTIVSLIIIILLTAISYIFIKLIKGIMTSLSTLKSGISEIGEGKLDYEIRLVENDELGELAKVLNNMSKQLRSTTVSRDLLLQEVKVRKKAEKRLIAAKKELEASNEELALMNEELEATNEELLNEIDERQKLEEYLIEAKKSAEAATEAKSQFLANMSHDLRTPLNAIIGFSEVLSMGAVGELEGRQKDCVIDILESGQHLLSLINEILDLSKIEAGKFDLNYSEIEVYGLIETTLIFIKEKATSKNIELVTDFSYAHLIIETDRLRLRQILVNLLSNAVKFTNHKGKITVRAGTCDEAGMITISIEDTGAGIKEEDIGKVFNIFEQVDSSYTKEYEGSGLGLALSRKIVELMGGKIWVESKFGKGSRFSFCIPCNQIEESS